MPEYIIDPFSHFVFYDIFVAKTSITCFFLQLLLSEISPCVSHGSLTLKLGDSILISKSF